MKQLKFVKFLIMILMLCLFFGCKKKVWNMEKKPCLIEWKITSQNINKVIMEIDIESDSGIKSSKLKISKDNFLTSIDYDLGFNQSENIKIEINIEDIAEGIYTAKILLENNLGTIEYESGKDAFSIGIVLSEGDNFQGGVIAYLFKEGDYGYDFQKQNGLVISEEYFSKTFWACKSDISETKLSIGHGRANTLKIIEVCNKKRSAVGFCYNYSKNGYQDWFLPSYDEMKKIYNYLLQEDGGFVQLKPGFWTSTQNDKEEALIYHPDCEYSNNCNIPKNSLVTFLPTRYIN
jgi:hypothetical protein